MSVKYQRNRIYSLIVGTEKDAVEINNLQIKFRVTKTSSNKDKKNEAEVEIYNLTEDRRKALEERFVRVSLKVGWSDTELVEVFTGQVIDIQSRQKDLKATLTKRENTDLITVLKIDELYESLNTTSLSKIVPAGKTIKDVYKTIVADIPEVTRYEMNGQNINKQVIDGFPLTGTPRQNLDKLSREHDVEWQIDQGVLYVSDVDGSFSDSKEGVFLVGQHSGLIERPEFKSVGNKRLSYKGAKNKQTSTGTPDQSGIISGERPAEAPKKKKRKGTDKEAKNTLKMTILMNPSIVAGSIFKLEFEDLTGYYKVDEVTHYGGFRDKEWYSDLLCTEKVG